MPVCRTGANRRERSPLHRTQEVTKRTRGVI
jgi:hypothetical protein